MYYHERKFATTQRPAILNRLKQPFLKGSKNHLDTMAYHEALITFIVRRTLLSLSLKVRIFSVGILVEQLAGAS